MQLGFLFQANSSSSSLITALPCSAEQCRPLPCRPCISTNSSFIRCSNEMMDRVLADHGFAKLAPVSARDRAGVQRKLRAKTRSQAKAGPDSAQEDMQGWLRWAAGQLVGLVLQPRANESGWKPWLRLMLTAPLSMVPGAGLVVYAYLNGERACAPCNRLRVAWGDHAAPHDSAVWLTPAVWQHPAPGCKAQQCMVLLVKAAIACTVLSCQRQLTCCLPSSCPPNSEPQLQQL